jgi:hypothetical protein
VSDAVFRLDFREFDKAMVDYAAASGKDFAAACNHATMNLAIQGIKHTKAAEASAIQKLKGMDWWPKYVAKVMVRQAGGKAGQKLYQSLWAKEEMKNHKKGAWKLDKEESAYVRYAKTLSGELLATRVKATRFMRFFFLSMARAVQPFADVKAMPSGKSFAGMTATAKPATRERPICHVEASYDYKKRSDKTARKAERLLYGWLEKAIPATIADMKVYVERKMAERARQFSARGAG